MARGWTKLFRRENLQGHDPLGRVLTALVRIFEGVGEEELLRELRAQMKGLFACEDLSIFGPDPGDESCDVCERRGDEWSLSVLAGWGQGNTVTQEDALRAPELTPGRRFSRYDDDLAKVGMLKAIALAYERDRVYALDIEERGLILVEDPQPEDDLGSGDFSILAIPLRYEHRVGRVVEGAPVGVLALYRTPVRHEAPFFEGPLRALLAQAVACERFSLQDPVTGLFTQRFLREELERQVNLFELTKGKLQGGLVVGWIDALCLYRQALESGGKLDPDLASQGVSRALRGVGDRLLCRARGWGTGLGPEHRCGYAGRIGADGFAVILPRLSPTELCTWARTLAQDVVEHHFPAEELLATGDLTVSLRVIPFGGRGVATAAPLWRAALAALDEGRAAQLRVRADAEALRAASNTLRVLRPADGAWVGARELSQGGAESESASGTARVDPVDVEGVGRLLDEHPPGEG